MGLATLLQTETEKLAKANAKIEELVDRLQASEGQRNSFLQLGSPEELASLAARNVSIPESTKQCHVHQRQT